MSIRAKLIAVIVLINAVIATAVALIVPSAHPNATVAPLLRSHANRISMALVVDRAMSEAAFQAERMRRLVAAGRDPADAINAMQQQLDSVATQLSFLNDNQLQRVAEVRDILLTFNGRLDELLAPPLTAERSDLITTRVIGLQRSIETRLVQMVESDSSSGLDSALNALGDSQRHLQLALAAVAGACLLSLILSVLAYRRLVRPLGAVTGSLNAVLAGRDPQDNLPETRDEFGDIVRAIRKLQAQSEHIRRLAYEDLGTGLPNRNSLDSELREVRRLRPIDGSHGLIMIGVDNYESLRSGFGLRVAESMMRAIAERLHNLDQMPVTVFRVEPHILGLLVDRGIAEVITRADLKRIAAQALLRLATPLELAGQNYLPTLNAGAAIYPDDARDAEEYVNVALEALQYARGEGPGSLQFGVRGHTHRQRKHLALADQIRLGLREGQFVPYFQPLVDASRHKVIGAEVLVRWRQPDGRVVLPAEFMQIAENTETIREMTRDVLTQACRSIKAWTERGFDLNVSFNVSAKLLTPHILQISRDALQASGLSPSRLIAEITETALVGNLDHASEILDALRESGMRLCLDDFGTGYSTLSHLYRFQIDRIKIDPVVTRAGASNDRAAEIIRAMAMLADRLGIVIVAEGIEHDEDAVRLAELGCPIQQGFHYSRAMPPEHFIEWARDYESRKAAA